VVTAVAILPILLTLAQTPDAAYTPESTEHIKPLAGHLFTNYLKDQKAIWTSPFHMNRKNAGLWIGIGAATAALLVTDHHTSTTFENGPTQVRWGNNLSRFGSSYTLVPVVAAFYAYGALKDSPDARETGILGAETLLDGITVYAILTPIAGRNRPNSAKEAGHFFEGGRSFPSGHAIEAWGLASMFAHQYKEDKWVPYVAYGLATVVTGSRFAARQHYAGDLLAGSAIGWFIGRYVYEAHSSHARVHMAPAVSPSTGTYALHFTIGR
jgi:hypothetical protein